MLSYRQIIYLTLFTATGTACAAGFAPLELKPLLYFFSLLQFSISMHANSCRNYDAIRAKLEQIEKLGKI